MEKSYIKLGRIDQKGHVWVDDNSLDDMGLWDAVQSWTKYNTFQQKCHSPKHPIKAAI